MIRTFIALALLLMPLCVQATAQSPDKIVIGGEKYYLNTNPLDSYLKKIEWQPPKGAAIWSSNWRGYLASWKIESGNLVLIDITIALKSDSHEDEKRRKSILASIFPDKEQVVADWYSGALIIPYGEMIDYIHMGYGSTYEKYQVLRVKNGKVVEHLHMSYSEFKTYKMEKFNTFQKTEMFKKEFKNLTKDEYEWSEDEALDFLQSYYAEHYLSQ